MLSIMKRDRERKVIVRIVKDALIPIIDNLKEDIRLLNKINIDSFPNFLDMKFGIYSRHLEGDSFNRFAARRYILKWRLFKYNKLCDEINGIIDGLKTEALDKKIITIITNGNGTRCTIAEQYEDNNITEILKNAGLSNTINDIVNAVNKKKLYDKAEKLNKKLGEIKEKYIYKYYMTEEEWENW